MKTAVYVDEKSKPEIEFTNEDEFENIVIENSKIIFGYKSVYLNAKKLIKSQTLGGAVPDGFLFNISDKENPEFYIVEAELSTHDFYKHIFPQVTKYLAFFRNEESKTRLVNAVWTAFNEDSSALSDLKSRIGQTEVYKFIKDAIDDSQNIIIVIDDELEEFHEIQKTYTDTWDKMVRVIIVKNYGSKKNGVITITPPFEQIDFVDAPTMEEKDLGEMISYTEEFHLEGTSQTVKDIYNRIKNDMLKVFPNLTINPRKYYISFKDKRNFVFILTTKKKVKVVVILEEDEVKKIIKSQKIKTLTQGVQEFWGGLSCKIILEDTKDLDEVIQVILKAKAKQD
jgi:predicted transport protein